MSDLEVRTAQRFWETCSYDEAPEAFARWNLARVRAGLPAWCHCGERESTEELDGQSCCDECFEPTE